MTNAMGRSWKSARWWQTVAILVLLAAQSAPRLALAQFRGLSSRFELSRVVQLDEIDGQARGHLARIDAYLADHQWDEAIEAVGQVMETHGGRVTPLADSSYVYVNVRDYCHRKIAALPDEAIQLYRLRVDPLAERWYEEGTGNRDAERLSRVVDELFCSTWGDDALLALGELSLERGLYGTARAYWTRIAPNLLSFEQPPDAQDEPVGNAQQATPSSPAFQLTYPDTDLDLAGVAARLVLISIMEGAMDRATMELAVFSQRYSQAEGRLGGRRVVYAEKLASLMEEADTWRRPRLQKGWQTFAGSSERVQELAGAVRATNMAWVNHIKLGPPLSVNHPMPRHSAFVGRRVAEDADKLLSYHPLVVDDLVLLNNQTHIFAFDLETGRGAWGQEKGIIYRPKDPSRQISRERRGYLKIGVPRFTMTAHAGKLYARMGGPVTSGPADPNSTARKSYLVCLDLKKQGAKVWEIPPDERDRSWAFEGSPLCDGENVYVGMRRSDVRPQAHVACFDAQTGEMRWRRFVSAAETPARGLTDEITHNLLTLAEGTLYYNTNLGSVAALSADDGRIHWVSLYPRAKGGDLSSRAAHFYRDLNPCIYYRGKLFVAPSDSEEIFALDAATGEMLWASPHPSDAIHLLGVASGNLIASGHRLWWLDVETGKVILRWPESPMAGVRGYGRGMIVGDEIYWPTRTQIHLFPCQPTFAMRETQLPILLDARKATGGNLLVVDGYLLIASADTLYGFTSHPREQKTSTPEIAALFPTPSP